MEAWKKTLAYIACNGLIGATFAGSVLPAAAQQAGGPEQRSPSAAAFLAANDGEPAKAVELPDSPGATTRQQSGSGQPWGAASSSSSSSSQTAQSQSSPAQTQPPPQKPVGTAVAEAPNASGVAASQPAGVAIAPAKQRRVRTIVLKVGAIVGAGVAVGSVVALTAGTSSKPPGAH